MNIRYIMLMSVLLCSATGAPAQETTITKHIVENTGTTLQKRFNPPDGYIRMTADGFGEYLRTLPLQKDGAKVHLYDGTLKNRQDIHMAVIRMDVGNYNLQQCADAVIRLRAEYLYQNHLYDKIHFNFTNGFNAAYFKWREGYRVKVNGNKCTWVKTQRASTGYESFRDYLKVVFSYAGTLSLSREMQKVPFSKMQIGDVLIQGGTPGHAVIVVDIVENKAGNKLFMLAQSYMPAQEIHILRNLGDRSISPWYDITDVKNVISTPQWSFSPADLKRFKD
ncbi:MAG: DUF4846 domain-containing protein [Chitinophagales bacterium]|nr:DUF4846 domain-containing protein [Chitinophagales bacterium]